LLIGNPVRFNGEKPQGRRHAPRLGEHNDDILSERGYSAEQIAAWREGRVIR
jgi:formyl-CoA transferase